VFVGEYSPVALQTRTLQNSVMPELQVEIANTSHSPKRPSVTGLFCWCNSTKVVARHWQRRISHERPAKVQSLVNLLLHPRSHQSCVSQEQRVRILCRLEPPVGPPAAEDYNCCCPICTVLPQLQQVTPLGQ
jgi:hypothetical protein